MDASEEKKTMEASEDKSEDETETTATEGLMTGMKLDDCIDEFRNTEPDSDWNYYIEVYPWHADDMTDKFVKVLRLADFSRVVMRKKKSVDESSESGKVNTPQLQHRQRMGCLQFYIKSRQSAKAVLRSMTWKTMVAKELTVEVTRRDSQDLDKPYETAYMELNTYPLCKCRFREKATGELKDRSARVSKIPGEISRGFLEVVLSRAFPVVGDAADKSFASDPLQKLEDIEDFKGVLDFDCMSRGSARSFVQAHKRIILNGTDLTVEPVEEQTMVVPEQPTPDPKKPKKNQNNGTTNGTRGRGRGGSARGGVTSRGSGARGGAARGRGGHQDYNTGHQGYVRDSLYRGNGRSIQPLMRPYSAPVPRNGPGMPLVPMTGRQKMNEKLRTGMRGAGPGSIGDSFKAELAHLHNQLNESTMALQEKLAMLQGGHDDFGHEGFGLGRDNFGQGLDTFGQTRQGFDSYLDSDMTTGYNDVSGGYDSWGSGRRGADYGGGDYGGGDYGGGDYSYQGGYAADSLYPSPKSKRGRGGNSPRSGRGRGSQRGRQTSLFY